MESYNYERFITETVEAMLPRFSSDEIVLVMGINSNMSLYKDGDEYCASERFLVIFHRPSNYTKVFIKKIEDRSKFSFLNMEGNEIDVEMHSDHDSCWRIDGMRWIFESWMWLRERLEEMGLTSREIRNEENWHFGYDIFGGSPKYYKVEGLGPVDRNEPYEKEWKITLGKKIPLKEIGLYVRSD